MPALAGEGGVGVGQIEQADRGVAEGEAEAVGAGVGPDGGEAERGEQAVERFGAAELVELAHRGDVERAGERAADGDRAAVDVVVVLGRVEAAAGAEAGRHVGDDRAREERRRARRRGGR